MKKLFLQLMIINYFVVFCVTNAVAANTKVDIIFVMDTSGSMDDEALALKDAIEDVRQDLTTIYDLETKAWGITETKSAWGLTSNVKREILNVTSNHFEDWGPATYDLTTHYSGWREGAVKVIVPISDEGPQNGGGFKKEDKDLDEGDDLVVKKARAALDKTKKGIKKDWIYTVPIISTGVYQDKIFKKYALIISDQAIKTGSGNLAEQFKTIIADIVAEASGASLGSMRASFKSRIFGGKLIIDAKGASKYRVIVKLDGVEIYNKETSRSLIPLVFRDYDRTISHTLNVNYTAYATDENGQILDSKNKSFTEKINPGNKLTLHYPEAITEKGSSEVIPTNSAAFDSDKLVKQSSYIADPVDISSGNFYFSHNDLVVRTAGIPLIIKRVYNSLETIRGWRFNIISTMDISDIDNITVSWQAGNSEDFFVKAKEGWISIYSTDTLTTDAEGFYVVTKSSGTKYKFDTDGKLRQITNKKNQGLFFDYQGSTIVIKDNFGNLLAKVIRNGSSQITGITDMAGNTISYTYSGKNLTSYTNRNGDIESYKYAGPLINNIVGSDGKAYVSNTYDAQGRVITQLNGEGSQISFSYTGDLPKFTVNKTEVTYANGVKRIHKFNLLLPTSIEGSGTNIAFEYDANNKVSKITDTNGKSWRYERNGVGLAIKSIDPQGNTILYEYDANNNITSSTNVLGQEVQFEYDASQNLIKVTNAEGKATRYEYNTKNQIVKIINSLNQAVTYTYNTRFQLETVTPPNGATTTYAYNSLGNVQTITDALGRIVTYKYDKEGKVIKLTNPMNYTTQMEYNSFGDLVKITDAKNRNVLMEYNVDGLLTKTTLVDGTTVATTYDVLGRVIATKDVLGRESKKEYDDFGRVSKIIDPKGHAFLLEYDNVGNITKITDAKGNNVKTSYDELYRPEKTIDADGVEVATTTYNALSMPTKVEDATGKSVEFSFDALNRLQESTLSGSIKAQVLYDALGHITKTIDPKGAIHTYEYDAVGNLVKETNPLNKENTYNYDTIGRVTSTQTPNGVMTVFSYDDLDRVIKISQTKGFIQNNTSYTYDEVGNPLTITNAQGTIYYTYNINDQVSTRVDAYGNKVEYEYNQVRRLKKLIYPDGSAVIYTYDDNNNLVKVTDFSNRKTLYEYDVNSNLVKTTHVNGAYTLYTYDNNSRLLTLKNYKSNGDLVSANELTRNSVGDITDNKETNPAVIDLSKIKNFTFEVNDFNQVTKSALGDLLNNITDSNKGDFIYDDNGNLLSYVYDVFRENTLVYDLSDTLSKATLGVETYNYTYDAEGNRTAVNSKRYVVDNIMGLSKPLAETGLFGINKYYIWTNGLGYSIDTNGNVLVYMYDFQGNSMALLDNNNMVKASYRYSSYGTLISADNAVDNPFKYLGQHGVQSDSSALYYVRSRYYSPELNRWTQADVKRGSAGNPLSLNRYVLNEGDGVNYIDISGYEKGKANYFKSIKPYMDGVMNVAVKGIDIYTISNIKGGIRTNKAISSAILKNFDVTGSLANVEKIAKNSKGNFRGTSLGSSSGVSKALKVSKALGAISTGITLGEEAFVTGDNYGKILASGDGGYMKAAKISSATAGLGARTISKGGTGTIRGATWVLSNFRYINPVYYLQGKEEFERGINMSNKFMDRMDKTTDEIYSGENIYKTISP